MTKKRRQSIVVIISHTQIVLTREIIDAIVISGHDGLLDDLMKLLLAAKLQEGLRQQILEAADKGTTKVLSRILKVCIDNNLFRFSGAIRAFDMWTGMGYGDNKPAHVQKYAQLAYKDRLHNNEGSVFASKLAFSNNAETCCEGIIFISTYAEKFVRGTSEVTPEEFKKLLVDEIFPCYKNLLKNELAMLYFKHEDDPKVDKHTVLTQTTHCSCEVTKRKKWYKRIIK